MFASFIGHDRQNLVLGKRKFDITRSLGTGSFAEVYQATDLKNNCQIAVKCMNFVDSGDDEEDGVELLLIKNEIKLMNKNICRLRGYDMASYEGSAFLLMEFCGRGELFHYVQKGRFPQEQALSIFHQLIEGVCTLHQTGIVHRDIKPENLLFNKNYTLKICDFGLSARLPPGQVLTCGCGTECYMSPEMHQNKPYGTKADVFSCGMILFILLSGSMPFLKAKTEAENSRWRLIRHGRWKRFWAIYENEVKFSEQAKSLMEAMLAPKEENRVSSEGVKEHPLRNARAESKMRMRSFLHRRYKKFKTQPKLLAPSASNSSATSEAIDISAASSDLYE